MPADSPLPDPGGIGFELIFDEKFIKKKITVKKGQMVFTPPMVDHAMVFNVDTTFLTLSRNFRDQKTYESDVVRIELIDPKDFITWKPNT